MRPDRLALLALLALAGFVGARAWLHDHPEHDPWAPLDLDDPPGWATARKLAALRRDPPACQAALARSEIGFTALPPTRDGDCRRSDRITLAADADRGLSLRPATPQATCVVGAGLALWLRNGVQPAAIAHLGSRVVVLEHLGTYSCRRFYGRAQGGWSQHATGNAIDIAGFVLADGRRIDIRRDWASGTAAGRFLAAAHESACGPFATVLGPGYNRAHADHFHLDQAGGRLGWSVCQ